MNFHKVYCNALYSGQGRPYYVGLKTHSPSIRPFFNTKLNLSPTFTLKYLDHPSTLWEIRTSTRVWNIQLHLPKTSIEAYNAQLGQIKNEVHGKQGKED